LNGLSRIQLVTAGYDYQYALDQDGQVWKWDKFKVTQSDPQQWSVEIQPTLVEELKNIVSIHAGGGWSHVITLDEAGNEAGTAK
jgi:alpha-tubulin suppressor-like RCC1 family protein